MDSYDNQSKIKGFYYDHQISNPLFTVTLHPNTRPFLNGAKVEWKNIKDCIDCKDDMIIKGMKSRVYQTPERHYDKEWDKFFTNGYSSDNKGDTNDGWLPPIGKGGDNDKWAYYAAEPICSSIFSEDFNFNISNEWSSWDGGNFVEDAFKSMKPYAPFLNTLSNNLQKIKDMDTSKEGKFGGVIANALQSGAEWLGNAAGKLSSTLNKALYIQGTRFTMYNGTATNFGNMTMKFTLLSDWKKRYPDEKEYHFMTVYDQFAYLYPYCIGFFEAGVGEDMQGFIADQTKSGSVTEILSTFANQYIGWQAPPGGYETHNRNIDVQQKGTLRMILGGYYTIDNLVIKNVSLNVSRTLCKDPTSSEDNFRPKMVPAYADVQIELQPASVYTDIKLSKFLNNEGMEAIIKSLAEANEEVMRKAIEEAERKNQEEKENNV